MGYYDQGPSSENRERRRRGGGGIFFSGLIGVIVGALLVLVAVPQLTGTDLFGSNNNANGVTTENKVDSAKTENVAVDVSSDVTKAVEKAGDSVVGISNIQSQSFWGQSGNDGSQTQEAGSGSGVIYKREGDKVLIVTNNHVIEGADQLEVTLSDGSKVKANARGADQWTDLAVIEIEGSNVKDSAIAKFGDSDKLKQGEPVIAIGNPLGLQFSGSVTQGIVSGVNRTIPVDINQDGVEDWNTEVIQTDAAINPGNSGGALVNISGQLVGINSMKIAQDAVEGIGLAIPINSAQPIIEDLEEHGEVKRPSMGITLQDVSEVSSYHQQETLKLPKDVKSGVLVRQVMPNSPAAQAKLQELDVIVELDGEKIESTVDLRKHLYTKKKVGDSMKVKFYRDGKLQEVTMKLTDESQL
ncbi:PDZ domain-containing protein [Rossellomorea marisflavi]|uniref:S1C family serine protease n=1 Tax=Rossellomorea marisflavi TaxID=189381 RepID=UPI00131979AF|nr:trypsin-like peptidase domain-containing protein [Rossellomorea marisflavi]QHA38259.1 PDZ domain-containing protein [Rossellomorea marisflavi]